MTTNFDKFISEVDREIREKLSTKTIDVWKDDYEADCLYLKHCEDIDEYEGGLTEDDDKNGYGFISQAGKEYFEVLEDRYKLRKKLYDPWDMNLDFMEVVEVVVMEEEMRWEIYYDVVMNKKRFDIKVEIRNGVVDVLHSDVELDDETLGNYTNLKYYRLIQTIKKSN
jgi:hypothetical protein